MTKNENERQNPKNPPPRRCTCSATGSACDFPPNFIRRTISEIPGAFDYAGYLAENGIVALGSTKAEAVELLPGFAGNRAELWRTRIRRSLIERIHLLWKPDEAPLLDAMLIGENSFLGRETLTDFQRTGTYHVLVISGLKVAVLALVMFWLLRRMRVSDVVASAITILLTVAYAVLTDVGAPVWRATLMLALYLGARLLYRRKSILNTIGAAALALLIVDPAALSGSQLSTQFPVRAGHCWNRNSAPGANDATSVSRFEEHGRDRLRCRAVSVAGAIPP